MDVDKRDLPTFGSARKICPKNCGLYFLDFLSDAFI